jgi:hypothetical protein
VDVQESKAKLEKERARGAALEARLRDVEASSAEADRQLAARDGQIQAMQDARREAAELRLRLAQVAADGHSRRRVWGQLG